jgi:hypothetical protein
VSSGEERGVGYAIGQSEDCLGTRTSPRNRMRFFGLKGVAEVVGIVMVRERSVARSFIVNGEGPLPSWLAGTFCPPREKELKQWAKQYSKPRFRMTTESERRIGGNLRRSTGCPQLLLALTFELAERVNPQKRGNRTRDMALPRGSCAPYLVEYDNHDVHGLCPLVPAAIKGGCMLES